MAKAEITNNVRELRFFHNEMTQQDLAEIVGCTRQTVNALEKGKYVPSLSLAFKIARLFGKTLEEVFQYSELLDDESE